MMGSDRSGRLLAAWARICFGGEAGEGDSKHRCQATGSRVATFARPSLPFYLRRPIPVATAHGRELEHDPRSSADHHEQMRALPGSRSNPPITGRRASANCETPDGVRRPRQQRPHPCRARARRAIMLAVEGQYASLGPCAGIFGAWVAQHDAPLRILRRSHGWRMSRAS